MNIDPSLIEAVHETAIGGEYQLLGDRVLVEVHKEEETTPSGLIKSVHKEALEKPQYGTVVLAGPGTYEHGVFVPVEVKPGDTVNFGKHAGQKITIGDRELLMLRRPDIFGYWRS